METKLISVMQNEDTAIAIRTALKTSLYPGASDASIDMVLSYCRAGGLDPITKPVHIVPVWDSKQGATRDVVMPGIGLYRTIAARCGCAGIGEPEFGPDVTETIGGHEITYPKWCRVTVKRMIADGHIVEFIAKELWRENYAVKGGKEKSIAPNAMWTKRPYGQLAKCAQAQALRMGFPEIGAQPTADEIDPENTDVLIGAQPSKPATVVSMPQPKSVPDASQQQAEDAAFTPASKPAQDAPAVRDVTPGVHGLTESQERILKARTSSAGLTYPQLLDKYTRIDQSNLNAVLNELRALAETSSAA